MSGKLIKVLIAKPGLDGHDVGAKLVCRALMDAGMEVIYTGLRQSPEAITAAAIQEDVDVIGLSILSGAHIPLTRDVKNLLDEGNASDISIFVGGCIPPNDIPKLKEIGAAGVFPTGTPFSDVVEFLQKAQP
ncbi:MAG: cobalamin B12-binding domain-containing protein [Planctomycetota bacterium]|jgi:methylmalonyl-CoA mutase C-terminal domain/subunit